MNRLALSPAAVLSLLLCVPCSPWNADARDAAKKTSYKAKGMPLPELKSKYGDRKWEIVLVNKHGKVPGNHLGKRVPGQGISFSLSVGPVDEPFFARSKRFAKGSPKPVIQIYEGGKRGGKVLGTMLFNGGFC